MKDDLTTQDAREIVCHGIRRLAAERFDSEKDLRTWLQDTLKLSYSATWRKLAGMASWEESDLAAVAHGLGMTFQDLLAALANKTGDIVTATLQVLGQTREVKTTLGDELDTDRFDFAAVDRDGKWAIVEFKDIQAGERPRRVLSMDLSTTENRQRLVAYVDDEVALTDTAKVLFARGGLDSHTFGSEEELSARLQTQVFDAYVLDWLLADRTAESLIKQIRATKSGKNAPIVVVTGQIENADADVEGDLTRVSREYGVSAMTKPIRWSLLGADLMRQLDQVQVHS